jgi:GT2 family glycosyltransferase
MREQVHYNIAVLITCYNRKQKTLNFLDSLTSQDYLKKNKVDIYLLDDASTDGTGEAVATKYPYVNIIKGTGSLFWAGGMRAIWRHAIANGNYDLFFIFNDDTILLDNAFGNLVKHYADRGKEGVMLIGSTLSAESNSITYGGNLFYNIKHSNYYRVVPDDNEFIKCQSGNANVLVVDKFTVEKIGIFPDDYVHCLADFDYTLTAYKNNIDVLVPPGYYAYCEDDHGVNWKSANTPLKKRIEYLYSPKGLAYSEYLHYIKKHFPADYIMAFIKLWMKTLFPIIWDKFKLKENH